MNLLETYQKIKEVSSNQPNIHTIVDTFTDLNREDTEYSAIVIQQREHQMQNGFITFNFYLGYVDRLLDDKSNELEIQSTAIEILFNIINELNLTCYPEAEVSQVSVVPFTQRFLAECSGAYIAISISIPVTDCKIF